MLNEEEVSNTEYICSNPGSTGLNSLIRTTSEPIGENCQFEGAKDRIRIRLEC